MPLLSLLPEEGVAPVVEVPPLGHPLHLPVRWVCSKYVLSLPSTYNFDEVGEFSGGRSLYSGHRKELGSSQFTMKIQHSDSGIFFFWVINIIWIYPFPSNEHCSDHLTMEYQQCSECGKCFNSLYANLLDIKDIYIMHWILDKYM